MFFETTTADEFFAALESGMKKNASFEGNLKKEQLAEAQVYLKEAAQALHAAGLVKEAELIMALDGECESCGDEAMEGLTSDVMLKNLEEKGWVFNADDCEYEEDEDLEVEDC